MSLEADAPRLEAWIDTDGDHDQLHIRVHENGRTYEDVDVDIDTLLRTEQYLDAFSRPSLSLLSLYDRHGGSDTAAEEDAPGEAEDLEVA